MSVCQAATDTALTPLTGATSSNPDSSKNFYDSEAFAVQGGGAHKFIMNAATDGKTVHLVHISGTTTTHVSFES
jgi:hypothetical protein